MGEAAKLHVGPDTGVMTGRSAAWRKAAEPAIAVSLARAVLVSLSMSSVGCIIPTPLEQQPATVNHPPKILTDEVMPPLVGTFAHSVNDAFTFTAVANDDDLGDTLSARLLFSHVLQGPLFDFADIKLTSAPSDELPGRRSGDFDMKEWCGVVGVPTTSNGFLDAYVAVTDRTFTDATDKTADDATELSTVHWTLQCM